MNDSPAFLLVIMKKVAHTVVTLITAVWVLDLDFHSMVRRIWIDKRAGRELAVLVRMNIFLEFRNPGHYYTAEGVEPC